MLGSTGKKKIQRGTHNFVKCVIETAADGETSLCVNTAFDVGPEIILFIVYIIQVCVKKGLKIIRCNQVTCLTRGILSPSSNSIIKHWSVSHIIFLFTINVDSAEKAVALAGEY